MSMRDVVHRKVESWSIVGRENINSVSKMKRRCLEFCADTQVVNYMPGGVVHF